MERLSWVPMGWHTHQQPLVVTMLFSCIQLPSKFWQVDNTRSVSDSTYLEGDCCLCFHTQLGLKLETHSRMSCCSAACRRRGVSRPDCQGVRPTHVQECGSRAKRSKLLPLSLPGSASLLPLPLPHSFQSYLHPPTSLSRENIL